MPRYYGRDGNTPAPEDDRELIAGVKSGLTTLAAEGSRTIRILDIFKVNKWKRNRSDSQRIRYALTRLRVNKINRFYYYIPKRFL